MYHMHATTGLSGPVRTSWPHHVELTQMPTTTTVSGHQDSLSSKNKALAPWQRSNRGTTPTTRLSFMTGNLFHLGCRTTCTTPTRQQDSPPKAMRGAWAKGRVPALGQHQKCPSHKQSTSEARNDCGHRCRPTTHAHLQSGALHVRIPWHRLVSLKHRHPVGYSPARHPATKIVTPRLPKTCWQLANPQLHCCTHNLIFSQGIARRAALLALTQTAPLRTRPAASPTCAPPRRCPTTTRPGPAAARAAAAGTRRL